MVKYKVKRGEPVIFDNDLEFEISKYILQIANEDKLNFFALNICRDHVHLIIKCFVDCLENIIRKIKGKSTQLYKDNNEIEDVFHLWQAGFKRIEIKNKIYFFKAVNYVINNRKKHELPPNIEMQRLVDKFMQKHATPFPLA